MLIVITNDDGVEAPGLVALRNAAAALGKPLVVAPALPQSSTSHAISGEVAVHRRQDDRLGEHFAVNGYPADAVRIALAELAPQPPRLVLSGINEGANIGPEVYYSGTVAAAREAALRGITAIALSILRLPGSVIDWQRTADTTRQVLEAIRPDTLPPATLLNINLPATLPDRPADAIRWVRTSLSLPALRYTRSGGQRNPDGDETCQDDPVTFVYSSTYTERPVEPDTDVHAVLAGLIAVAALRLDPSAPRPRSS